MIGLIASVCSEPSSRPLHYKLIPSSEYLNDRKGDLLNGWYSALLTVRAEPPMAGLAEFQTLGLFKGYYRCKELSGNCGCRSSPGIRRLGSGNYADYHFAGAGKPIAGGEVLYGGLGLVLISVVCR